MRVGAKIFHNRNGTRSAEQVLKIRLTQTARAKPLVVFKPVVCAVKRKNALRAALLATTERLAEEVPDDVLLALYRADQKVMQQLVASDPMAAKVNASYQKFYAGVRAYHHISEQAYINARDVVLDAPPAQAK